MTRAQRPTSAGGIFCTVLNDPNVTYPFVERGQRADLQRFTLAAIARTALARPAEAVEAVRQPDDRFRAERIRLARRFDDGVAQAVVDRLQPGRLRVTQPGHLDRRGSAREDQQAIVARVAGEVHEDVDAVGADERGHFLVAPAEMARHWSAAACNARVRLIHDRAVGVAETPRTDRRSCARRTGSKKWATECR